MDVFNKFSFSLAIIFIVLAFGGTVPWAFTVLQGAVFALLIKQIFTHRVIIAPPFKPIMAGFVFIILFTLLQACFQVTLLDPVPFYPATFIRLYTLEHASIFLTWFAVCFLASQLPADFKEVRWFTAVLIISASIVVLAALAAPGEYIKAFFNFRGGYGPFLNRNHGGLFAVIGALSALSLTGYHFTRKAKYFYEGKNAEFYAKQAALILLTAGLCIASVLSRSRGAMAALGGGIVLYTVIMFFIFLKSLRGRVLAFICLALVLLLSATAVFKYQDNINKFAMRRDNVSGDIRKMLYTAAFDMLKERPAFGIGAGALPVSITQYTSKPINQYIARLHSDPLELLLSFGLVGFMPLLACVLWFVFIVFRRIRGLSLKKQMFYAGLISVCAAIMVSACIDFPFFIPACAIAFFMATGLLCAMSFYRDKITLWRCPVWLKIALVLLCLCAFYISLRQAMAWRSFQFGKGLSGTAQISYYQNSLDSYPSPRYALRLGLAYYKASLDNTATQEERLQSRALAHNLAEEYLQKYPKEKELSRLYMNTLPQ